MNKFLKNKLVIIAACLACGCLYTLTASANQRYVGNYDLCNQESGYRADYIGSVYWACSNNADHYDQFCTLWLGGSDSVDPTIEVESLTGTHTAYYYGMCTEGSNATSSITVSYDNNSIGDSDNISGGISLYRSTWGSPNSTQTWIDIEKFVEGLTPEITSEGYQVYKRTVDVERCHGGNSSCSSMSETVTVKVKVPVEFYSSSHASNRATSTATSNSSDYVTTGIVKDGSSVSTTPISIYVGGTANITFSHNVYSNVSQTNSKNWTVTRTLNIVNEDGTSVQKNSFQDTSRMDISMPASSSNSANSFAASRSSSSLINVSYNNAPARFIAASRPYSDGAENYVHRDFYTITFNKKGVYTFCEKISIGGKQTSGACSVVTVEMDPDDCVVTGTCPTSTCATEPNTTEVSALQKNSSVPRFSSYTENKIYAKPTDTIDYRYQYCAGVQAVANTTVTKYHGAEGGNSDTSNTNTDFSDAITWNNFYRIDQPRHTKTNSFRIGEITEETYDHSSTIVSNDVGSTLTGKITSSTPIWASDQSVGEMHTWTYTYSCTDSSGNPDTCSEDHSHTNDYYDYSYTAGPATDEVEVRVPYNYVISDGTNPSDITINKTGKIYAGENFTLSQARVGVNTLYSDTLQQTYATKTQSATISLYAFWLTKNESAAAGSVQSTSNLCDYYRYYSNAKDCTEIDSTIDVLNEGSNLNGATETYFSGRSYNVFDIDAGSQLCVAYQVSLAQSSSDPDSNSTNGNTFISKSDCYTVYKKPIFQVWGGSLYSAGRIAGNNIAKTNLAGYTSYAINSGAKHYYTSWVEYSINGASDIANISSANATGGSVTGASENSTCKLGVLTLANAQCASSNIGRSGVVADKSERDAFVNYYIGNTTNPEAGTSQSVSGSVDLSQSSSYIESNGIRHTHSDSSISITASSSLTTGRTHTVAVNGDIMINSDLTYSDVRYTNIRQLPQYIIFADGNIKIACSVDRVDAILIATENIDTCYDGGDDNSQARSNQLKINGVIIADSLTLGRTYGAATGADTSVPAEIINATPVNFYSADTDVNDTPSVYTTYLREISPRY